MKVKIKPYEYVLQSLSLITTFFSKGLYLKPKFVYWTFESSGSYKCSLSRYIKNISDYIFLKYKLKHQHLDFSKPRKSMSSCEAGNTWLCAAS